MQCACCNGQLPDGRCGACEYAIGFHKCHSRHAESPNLLKWKAGSLYKGTADAQEVLILLARKGIPIEILREKANAYRAQGVFSDEEATHTMRLW